MRMRATLPLHFGASGVGAAVGLLELMGHEKNRALQALGLGAAMIECWEGWRIESRLQPGLDPLKHGSSGTLVRAGGALSGPVPAALRVLSVMTKRERSRRLRRWASISAVAGSLLTRIAWIQAGHVSAKDWREPLGIRRTRFNHRGHRGARNERLTPGLVRPDMRLLSPGV